MLVDIITLADVAREAARERQIGRHDVGVDEVGTMVSAVSQPPAAAV